MSLLELTTFVGSASLIAGFLGSLTGLGGGVVIVPLLALVFHIDIRYAIGASLVSVIATSSGAAAAYVREGYSNVRIRMFLEMATTFGALVGAALGGRIPAQAAAQAIEGTELADPAVRKALINGGESAVKASRDPAIEMARRVNPVITETQEWYRDNVESVLTAAGEKLGRARFAVYGKREYPDANFTLRLAYGTVKGYPMNGTQAPPITTFYGLYDRAYSFGLHHPYDLPDRWLEDKENFKLSTPFNFVNTCDIVGGNSGSPVVNREGELVGLIFDGNIESLAGTYIYDERQNRAVTVHSAVIMAALPNVYGASSLADEIEQSDEQNNTE